MEEAKTYEQYKQDQKSEQGNRSYDDIKNDMNYQTSIVAELDNLPKQNHIWVDRGVVVSCEGAGHANHRSFKKLM